MWRNKSVSSAKPQGSDCIKKGWHEAAKCKRRDAAVPESRPFKLSRSGLLNAQFRDAPTKQQTTMERNSQKSRLLSLPPEIRNRIFLSVLGGQDIHVCYQPHERRYYNRATGNYILSRSATRSARQKGDLVAMHYGGGLCYDIVSKTDGNASDRAIPLQNDENNAEQKPDWQKLHLTLLRVCRQIYSETFLVPYFANSREFENHWVWRKFRDAAKPIQRRAIEEGKERGGQLKAESTGKLMGKTSKRASGSGEE